MKLLKLAATVAILAALPIIATAQQPPASQQPSGGQPAAAASLPAPGQIRVIDTSQFAEGIQELKARIQQLNNEFDSKRKELQMLQEQITQLENEVQRQTGVANPQALQAKVDRLDKMKRDHKRSAEDAEAEYNRRMREVVGPVYDKIGQFLNVYAAQRGILIIFDLAGAVQSNVLAYSDKRNDITEDFMNEYNKTYPVATPAPAASKPNTTQQPTTPVRRP